MRKVFARSYLAKDVRGFVQSSNLARLEMASPVPAMICNSTVSEFEDPLRCSSDDTRIDWSRYLDSDAEDEGPPLLNLLCCSYYLGFNMFSVSCRPRSRSECCDRNAHPKDEQARSGYKISPETRITVTRYILSSEFLFRGTNGWNLCTVRRGNEKRLRLAVEGSSKWSEYWQEDGTHERVEAAGVSPDRHVGFDGEDQSQSSGAVFDEEVHPDFL